jgi:hypothetical protein
MKPARERGRDDAGGGGVAELPPLDVAAPR